MDSTTKCQQLEAVDAIETSSLTEALPDTVTHGMLLQCERLGDQQLSQVFRFNATTIVKRINPASAVRAEVAAMQLVRERTSVPVPRVLKTVIPNDDEDKYGIIFMEYMDGSSLQDAWPLYTAEDKQSVMTQLKGYFHQLRQIEGDYIGSIDKSVCNDQLFANRENDYGPYKDEEAFRAGIAQSLRACDANAFTQTVVNMVNAMPKSKRTVLTHGDLAPRNILVRDGNVVAIVDWEMSGFYPEYWEYAKAHFFADYDHAWMEDGALDGILDPFRLELAALLHTRGIFMY